MFENFEHFVEMNHVTRFLDLFSDRDMGADKAYKNSFFTPKLYKIKCLFNGILLSLKLVRDALSSSTFHFF